MKILCLGAAGMLGQAVMDELARGPTGTFDITGRTRFDYDIRDESALAADIGGARPEVVINCAAYTRVDDAEDEEDLAFEINGRVPGILARACRKAGSRLVHISTDYVFDGEGRRPYREDDPTGPINAYGRSKLAGEEAVMREHPEGHLIARVSWLFGPGGNNFVETMLRLYGEGRREFNVVEDQVGRPTYTFDLARLIGGLISKGSFGLFHAANSGSESWRGFAKEIFHRAGVSEEVSVEAVPTSAYPTKARRPGYSVLDTSKVEAEVGHAMPAWQDALARYVKRTEATRPWAAGG